MTQLVYLIEQIAPAIYLFCAAGVLFWLGRFFAAQAALRAAEFELERELEEQRRARALTWTIGLVELGLAALAIATVVAPTLRADLLNAGLPIAPESGAEQRFATSTPGGDGNEAEGVFLTVTAQALSGGGAFLQLTAVASPTPVGTIIAGYPTPIGCNSEQASLEVPANGMRVFDTLTVSAQPTFPISPSTRLRSADRAPAASSACWTTRRRRCRRKACWVSLQWQPFSQAIIASDWQSSIA
jgi:hypothetical protein